MIFVGVLLIVHAATALIGLSTTATKGSGITTFSYATVCALDTIAATIVL